VLNGAVPHPVTLCPCHVGHKAPEPSKFLLLTLIDARQFLLLTSNYSQKV
jgi:hypothetical protein